MGKKKKKWPNLPVSEVLVGLYSIYFQVILYTNLFPKKGCKAKMSQLQALFSGSISQTNSDIKAREKTFMLAQKHILYVQFVNTEALNSFFVLS